MSKKTNLRLCSKVWIEDENGQVVFGKGRMRILETVRRLGSLHAAAKELGMGYRAIWGKIKETEERLGEPLLIRNVGGHSGGGSILTDTAMKLMDEFSRLERITESISEEFDKGNHAP